MEYDASSKPSLLFYAHQFGRNDSQGGVGVSSKRIVDHLQEKFKVSILRFDSSLSFLETEKSEESGVTIFSLGLHPEVGECSRFLRDFIIEKASNEKFRGVMTFYLDKFSYAVFLASKYLQVPHVAFCRGNDINVDIYGPQAFQLSEIVQNSEAVIVNNHDMYHQITSTYPSASPDILPNGIDYGLWSPSQVTSREATDLPTIGLFGDIKFKKGLGLLLEAFDFKRFRLKIVGAIRADQQKLLHGFLSLNPEYIEKIEVVEKTTVVNELKALYASVDVVCLPSFHEGLPNVLLEAMSLGKFCIGSNIGGIKDLIKDGETGLLFDKGSVSSLNNTLKKWTNLSIQDRFQIESNARDLITRDYGLENEKQRLYEVVGTVWENFDPV